MLSVRDLSPWSAIAAPFLPAFLSCCAMQKTDGRFARRGAPWSHHAGEQIMQDQEDEDEGSVCMHMCVFCVCILGRNLGPFTDLAV